MYLEVSQLLGMVASVKKWQTHLSLHGQSFLQFCLGWSLRRQPEFEVNKCSCEEAISRALQTADPLEPVEVKNP